MHTTIVLSGILTAFALPNVALAYITPLEAFEMMEAGIFPAQLIEETMTEEGGDADTVGPDDIDPEAAGPDDIVIEDEEPKDQSESQRVRESESDDIYQEGMEDKEDEFDNEEYDDVEILDTEPEFEDEEVEMLEEESDEKKEPLPYFQQFQESNSESSQTGIQSETVQVDEMNADATAKPARKFYRNGEVVHVGEPEEQVVDDFENWNEEDMSDGEYLDNEDEEVGVGVMEEEAEEPSSSAEATEDKEESKEATSEQVNQETSELPGDDEELTDTSEEAEEEEHAAAPAPQRRVRISNVTLFGILGAVFGIPGALWILYITRKPKVSAATQQASGAMAKMQEVAQSANDPNHSGPTKLQQALEDMKQ